MSTLELKIHSTVTDSRTQHTQFYAVPIIYSQVDHHVAAYNCDNENSQVSVVKLETIQSRLSYTDKQLHMHSCARIS